ncbi:hypothetical protein [Vibrio europaeus]|uniref:hypothetical protein n=1 Tax=Vibrio europaeus TaxID=300876 RepID=UPI00233E5B28|nr:hypothetical protein [Vibrio europaeus]MDC5720583.1 hypothetical protein [Vibrio europaeus]
MFLKLIEFFGISKLFQKHLNDPVNWVAFIRRHELSKEQQKQWRDHLRLNHRFEGELEG